MMIRKLIHSCKRRLVTLGCYLVVKSSGSSPLKQLSSADWWQKRRKEEITVEMINTTCLMTFTAGLYKEVSQASCSPGAVNCPT